MRWIVTVAAVFGVLGGSPAHAQGFTPDQVDRAAAVKEGNLT